MSDKETPPTALQQTPLKSRKRAARDPKKMGPRQPPGAKTEVGGPKGLEPTRYGDWERGGRCVDF
ncbi:MAG: DUF1674 domain-containing protein [Alphaproteobacteria bacterium]|nr:DUF1674 domain-containing protein [Alphaproteobacteria bacterium]